MTSAGGSQDTTETLLSDAISYYDGPYREGILNIFSTKDALIDNSLRLFVIYLPDAPHMRPIKFMVTVYNVTDLVAEDVVLFAQGYIDFMLPGEDDEHSTLH